MKVKMYTAFIEVELRKDEAGNTAQAIEDAARFQISQGRGNLDHWNEWEMELPDKPAPEPKGSIVDRMRDGGMTLEALLKHIGSGKNLATLLNGLSLLEVGYAQPEMAEDGPDTVYDGYWEWLPYSQVDPYNGVMMFRGSKGPGGEGGPVGIMVRLDQLVQVF